MKILFKFASRERPDKFLAAIDNIVRMSASNDYLILCSLDEDDTSMTTEVMLQRIVQLQKWVNIDVIFGTSTSKIDAINRDVLACSYPWDILCCHSDDMVFIKTGFDSDIREAFDGFSGLVHFPDQVAKNRLCTYAMMDRAYYDRFHFIYHPSYRSVYADNEQHEVAVNLGMYKFVDKQILEHRHAIWGYGQPDRLLKHTESFYPQDMATYKQRKAAGFP